MYEFHDCADADSGDEAQEGSVFQNLQEVIDPEAELTNEEFYEIDLTDAKDMEDDDDIYLFWTFYRRRR